MPYNLEMVHLIPGPHGEYKTAGYTHALPHQEESFSSTAGTTADQMGRVLPGDFTVEPPVWLVCETHTSLSESQIGRVSHGARHSDSTSHWTHISYEMGRGYLFLYTYVHVILLRHTVIPLEQGETVSCLLQLTSAPEGTTAA